MIALGFCLLCFLKRKLIMKYLLNFVFILLTLCFTNLKLYAQAQFQKSLVIEGQNFNTAIHIGIFDGLAENGWKPNVVIASCGGAIAAALIHVIPDPHQRRQFLFSEDFFSILKAAQYSNPGLCHNIGNITKLLSDILTGSNYVNLFKTYLLEVPNVFAAPMDQPFKPAETHIVIIGAWLISELEREGYKKEQKQQKVYKEVFFTDKKIASLLENWISPVAISFPDSAISLQTGIMTNQSVGTAARVSISDPYLINPLKIEGSYFIGGAIDLYSIETAYRLADEVAIVYPNALSKIEYNVLNFVFGFNNNARLREVTNMYAKYWIDFSDFEELGDHLFGIAKINILKNQLALNIPSDLDSFRVALQAQWEFGYARAVEALKQSPNSKSHIRRINKGNTSKEIRDQINRQRNYKSCQFYLL